MSSTRRAGADNMRLFENALDEAPQPQAVILYPKDAGGVTQLFAVVPDGAIYQLTPTVVQRVEYGGVPIGVGPWIVLNFQGAGVAVADAGGGEATITVDRVAFSPPEAWGQNGIPRNSDLNMQPLVSTHFETIKLMRAGSLVGLCSRLDDTITAGTMTIEVYLNGVGTGLTIVHSAGGNQTGGISTSLPGVITYGAGDLIGLHLTSDNAFAPDTANVEAWIELTEGL